MQVLRRLGLEGVPVEQVQALGDRVAGIPLCLEWLARLARDPLELDAWWDLADEEQNLSDQQSVESITRRIGHLLEEPDLVEGHLASHAGPLLQRLLDTHLSKGARQVLEQITVVTIPLGGPALQRLCPRPALLKELRDASLLAAAANRVQVLPMVAAMLTAQRSSEQTRMLEEHLIEGLTSWLEEGMMGTNEAGAIVAELATVYLRHHRLLDAAELLIRYGWLSFNQGYGPRLARLSQEIIEQFDWKKALDNECGCLLLHYLLAPFLGQIIDTRQRFLDYQRIHNVIFAGEAVFLFPTEVYVTHHMMVYAMSYLRFEEAQKLLEVCYAHLEPLQDAYLDLQASLLEKRAWLFGTWCEYVQEQGDMQAASLFREQTIAICRQCITLLSACKEQSPLKESFLKKRLARALNNLGYHLNRFERYEEALQVMEWSIDLKEQGYVEFDTLADAYGEKSQILAGLGRFREALFFDEKAFAEVQRLASAGHTLSQEEIWIYQVNRGRLYLRLGKVHEAEKLIREAFPRIHPRRRMYRMFAEEAFEEIEQWRQKATSPQYQLDWRWVERYRELDAFDSYWWLASAGSFTREEQQQWERIYTPQMDKATKEHLSKLFTQSRDRELATALAEQREPHFHYPALDIDEVHRRISGMLQLDTEIQQKEPNAIVRRLYHGAIEEELNFLRLIEATYNGDNERFWQYNLLLNPIPTPEELKYAWSRVRRVLIQGLMHLETKKISEQIIQLLREQFHLSLDLSYDERERQELQKEPLLSSSQPTRTISPQAAKRFFEAILQENGYEGWQVELDPNASSPRVEQGLRYVFLPSHTRLSVDRCKEYLLHELGGHVARCVAGEHSPLGLLGINTKNSLETEEGLAVYYERQAAVLYKNAYDDSGSWLGTLATGLASGVLTPPQTFLSLFAFFEPFLLLYRLVRRRDEDRQTAQKQARKRALERCLRTYRGVPRLEKAGVCYTKDAHYLRGLWLIESAIAQDEKILDRLAVGVVAVENLPDLQELGLVAATQSLKKLALDPNLDAYILSFEVQSEEHSEKQ